MLIVDPKNPRLDSHISDVLETNGSTYCSSLPRAASAQAVRRRLAFGNLFLGRRAMFVRNFIEIYIYTMEIQRDIVGIQWNISLKKKWCNTIEYRGTYDQQYTNKYVYICIYI